MTDFVYYPSPLGYQGPRYPVALDTPVNGADTWFMQSVTNNARSYAVHVPALAGPEYESGFGYTETSTSNADFMFRSEFVYPGLVPTTLYRDSDSTYRVATFQISGTDLSVAASVAYPSQTYASSGFIRAFAVYPDEPVFFGYGGGANSGSPTTMVYPITMAAGGGLSISGPSAVSYPAGTFPGAGANYLSKVSDPLAISDRFAWQDNTRALYDRQNPTQIMDGYAMLPAGTGGADATRDMGWFASARVMPSHLYCLRRGTASFSDFKHVADFQITSGGSTSISLVGTWSFPAGTTYAVGGLSILGKAVVYTTDGSTVRGFYDVFGLAEEFTVDPAHSSLSGYSWVAPVGLPGLTGDAWLTVNGSSLGGYMFLVASSQAPSISGAVGPQRTRYVTRKNG